MFSLLEQIKMTQSQMTGMSSAMLHEREPGFLQEMVRTCAEAILIEVVTEQNGTEPPETNIREYVGREDFQSIVYTWAEELEFEQVCSEKVLD